MFRHPFVLLGSAAKRKPTTSKVKAARPRKTAPAAASPRDGNPAIAEPLSLDGWVHLMQTNPDDLRVTLLREAVRRLPAESNASTGSAPNAASPAPSVEKRSSPPAASPQTSTAKQATPRDVVRPPTAVTAPSATTIRRPSGMRFPIDVASNPLLQAAEKHGLSPWTVPLWLKPASNRGCTFAAHDQRLLHASLPPQTPAHTAPVRWVRTVTASSYGAEAMVVAENDPLLSVVELPSASGVLDVDGNPIPDTVVGDSRRFRPLAAYPEEYRDLIVPDDLPLCARCGRTGKFFTRESVVDALLFHAATHRYKSPFWIEADHPRLQTGYIELKPESRPINVREVALVFPATRLPEGVVNDFFHPMTRSPTTRRPGVNLFTGQESKNPALRTGEEYNEGWVTLDQLLEANLQIKAAETSFKSFDPTTSEGRDGGKFVVLQDFALYNADQLERPGKLANTLPEERVTSSLFQPIFPH